MISRAGRTILMLLTTYFSLTVVSAQVLDKTAMVRSVTRDLQQLLDREQSGIAVQRLFLPQDVKVPDGEVTWVVDLPKQMDAGRQAVPVAIYVNGEVVREMAVVAELERRLKVPVVQRTLKRNDVVAASDVSWETVSFRKVPEDLITEADAVVGKAATRMVTANRPLQAGWFNTPLAVGRGEKVTVLMEMAGLHIRALGVADAEGRVGEFIQVRNPDSQVRFAAKVVGPGEVRVDGR
ncbi:MAG: flagellar basal body P-ring formation protein FlgA [Magnetococcales bacterium]|nr:flagellar basal body P-ring formation protein FlgA [Magnetococcales bacterium]